MQTIVTVCSNRTHPEAFKRGLHSQAGQTLGWNRPEIRRNIYQGANLSDSPFWTIVVVRSSDIIKSIYVTNLISHNVNVLQENHFRRVSCSLSLYLPTLWAVHTETELVETILPSPRRWLMRGCHIWSKFDTVLVEASAYTRKLPPLPGQISISLNCKMSLLKPLFRVLGTHNM